MTKEEKAEEYADKILFDSKYLFIFNKEKVKAYIIKVYLDSLKCCEEAYNKGLAEGRKELKEKISVLLSCTNYPENKGGWICVKEYENKCLAQKIEFIKELEKEKCELLGIIQGKDKVMQELEKEIAELDCQKNRNKACYSCANATERCFKNEIGCPCEKYKSYKDENAELKGIKDIATLIRANNSTVITLMQLNNMLVNKNQQLTKAKELLTKWVELFKPKGGNIPPTPIQVETEQFIREVEK